MSNTFKVVLLGEGRVGKTSLVSRFVHDTFDAEQPSTVQANMYFKKKIQLDNGASIDLSIWDTAGQERFHALGPIYYRGAQGAVLVYDITDRETFSRVQHWVKELKLVLGDGVSGGSTLQLVICGNKCDRERERDVDLAVAEAYAKKEGAVHLSTSAMTGQNVVEAFETLGKRIARVNGVTASKSKRGGGGGAAASSSAQDMESSVGLVKKKKGALRVVDDEDEGTTRAGGGAAASSPPVVEASTRRYDDYDDPPPASRQVAPPPPAAATNNNSNNASTADRRRQTITLDKTKDQQQQKQAAGGGGGDGGSKGGEPKKGGCCK